MSLCHLIISSKGGLIVKKVNDFFRNIEGMNGNIFPILRKRWGDPLFANGFSLYPTYFVPKYFCECQFKKLVKDYIMWLFKWTQPTFLHSELPSLGLLYSFEGWRQLPGGWLFTFFVSLLFYDAILTKWWGDFVYMIRYFGRYFSVIPPPPPPPPTSQRHRHLDKFDKVLADIAAILAAQLNV